MFAIPSIAMPETIPLASESIRQYGLRDGDLAEGASTGDNGKAGA